MKTRTFGTSGHPRLRGRLRPLDRLDGLVGRALRRICGRAPARGVRPRHHLLRHRRHLRRGPRRDAARTGARRRPRRHHDRDEVRVRHLLAAGSARATSSGPTTGRPSSSASRSSRASRAWAPTTSTSTSSTTRAWTRSARDAVFEVLEEARDGGQDPCLRRRARPGDRLARRGPRRVLARRPLGAGQIIHNLLEQDPGRELIEAARGTRHRAHGARPALLGHARGQVHEGHGLRRERPPPPPPEGVAGAGPPEGRAARLPRPRSRTLGQAAIKWLLRRAGDDHRAPEHLRLGAAARVRRCARDRRPLGRRPRPASPPCTRTASTWKPAATGA